MDRNKIREFVRQAHPNRRIVTEEVSAAGTTASSDDRDIDVGNLELGAWKKLAPSGDKTPMADGRNTDDAGTDMRSKFRPRKLTGGKAQPGKPLPQDAGKIALEHLEFSPGGAGADASQDSLDVLVDEEHGIIGESDSAPEKKR